MKKSILSFAFLLFACIGLQRVFAHPPIVISIAKFKLQNQEIKSFNAIAAAGPIEVVVTMGNKEDLRLEGDQDAIAALVTEVKGNVLIIRPKTSWKSWTSIFYDKKVTAYVSAKQLNSLTMSGSGSINVNGTVKNQNLTVTLSGSGNINAKIDVNNFTGIISGSGDLNIAGTANNASITISGSGSLTKKGIATNNLSVQISGSGNVNAQVQNSINAVISGSGSVNYTGNPTIESKIVGSGKVRKI